jgi:hypothetical protein
MDSSSNTIPETPPLPPPPAQNETAAPAPTETPKPATPLVPPSADVSKPEENQPAEATSAADVTPTSVAVSSDKQTSKGSKASKKPILIVVSFMVLFVSLCALAYYAYSQSN